MFSAWHANNSTNLVSFKKFSSLVIFTMISSLFGASLNKSSTRFLHANNLRGCEPKILPTKKQVGYREFQSLPSIFCNILHLYGSSSSVGTVNWVNFIPRSSYSFITAATGLVKVPRSSQTIESLVRPSSLAAAITIFQ